VIGVRRSRRTATAATLTAVLLSLALTGCGGRLGSGTTQNSGTTQHTSTGTSSPAAQQEGSGQAGMDQQTAAQIEGAVNDAQSELDGLDQDFVGDDAAAN
jgi:hypothetical protein